MRAQPVAKEMLFDRRKLPYGRELPDIVVAGVTMRNTMVPILFGGSPVLRFDPPPISGAAVEISLTLGLPGDKPRPVIVRNEWMPDSASEWTFERPANRYVVTHRDRAVQMILAILKPDLIVVEMLRSFLGDRMLETGPGGTRVDGVLHETPPSKSQLVGMMV